VRTARVRHKHIIQHTYSRGLDLPSLNGIGPDVSLLNTGPNSEGNLLVQPCQRLRAAQPQSLHHVAARIWQAALRTLTVNPLRHHPVFAWNRGSAASGSRAGRDGESRGRPVACLAQVSYSLERRPRRRFSSTLRVHCNSNHRQHSVVVRHLI
jgi:hypothetical protein